MARARRVLTAWRGEKAGARDVAWASRACAASLHLVKVAHSKSGRLILGSFRILG